RTFRPNPGVLYFFPAGDRMFAQLINDDFSLFDGEQFQRLIDRNRLEGDNVVAVLPQGNDYLLVTSKSGIYRLSEDLQSVTPWRTGIDKELGEAIVNRAAASGDSLYVLGTLNN